MIFQENCLLADGSHEISYLIFVKTRKNVQNLSSAAVVIGALRVKITNTVKPAQNSHSKIDKTKILMTNGSLMKVVNIAECSPWSILQYF